MVIVKELDNGKVYIELRQGLFGRFMEIEKEDAKALHEALSELIRVEPITPYTQYINEGD